MNPEQPNKDAAACSLLRTYQEQPFIKHEWEELVEKFCLSEDPGLREVGLRELENIQLWDPAFKIIERS